MGLSGVTLGSPAPVRLPQVWAVSIVTWRAQIWEEPGELLSGSLVCPESESSRRVGLDSSGSQKTGPVCGGAVTGSVAGSPLP